MKRRVHRINKAGDLNNLKLIEEDLPDPSVTEITVRTEAVGLNFADIFALTGLYSATPKGSFIPGLEYSGTVIKKGSDVTRFNIGDKVMGVTRFGAYADHLNIDEKYAYPIPVGWTMEEGAAFIAQGLTAYYALIELGNLKKGQTVLIHSAAGGVGILANRIARKFEAYTIGCVGNESKLEVLKQEGFMEGFVRGADFRFKLEKILNNRDLHLVLECNGGTIFQDSYNALSPGGRIVTYGSANFTPTGSSPNWLATAFNYLSRPMIDPLHMPTENKSVMAFNLIWLWDKIEELSSMLENLLKLELKPQKIGHIFPFEKALDALYLFKSGTTVGKVILKI